MLYTDKVKEIEQKLGIDAKKLPNNLLTTHLCAICDCLSDSGGGIVDVEVLPNEYGWVGTPITKDTKRVYFNTNLSPEKIENLQNFVSTSNSSIIEDYGGYHNIGFYNNEIDIDFGDYYLYENSVWNKSILTNGQYLDIDWEIHFLTEYNVKLAPLFSSTPFKKVDTNAIYRLPDGTLWMYHNDEWKELSFGGSGGSAGVQLKLVERQESETTLVNGYFIELQNKLKPNTVYSITIFSSELGETISELMPIGYDGVGDIRASIPANCGAFCGKWCYFTNNGRLCFYINEEYSEYPLDPITKLEIYELTSSATQTEDEPDLSLNENNYISEEEADIILKLSDLSISDSTSNVVRTIFLNADEISGKKIRFYYDETDLTKLVTNKLNYSKISFYFLIMGNISKPFKLYAEYYGGNSKGIPINMHFGGSTDNHKWFSHVTHYMNSASSSLIETKVNAWTGYNILISVEDTNMRAFLDSNRAYNMVVYGDPDA